jgi:hypothetical protein
MNYRLTEILPTKTLDASGTLLVDLNLKDPISALMFEYKNTRGSTTMADHLLACLSSIELIDGSEVLFSLNGAEMHALDYYDKGKSPYLLNTNISGNMGLAGLSYNFGRKLWDPELALDPKKYANPQLQIAFNRVTWDASSSAHTLKIMALCFDEKSISPVGFLRSKEVYNYTCGAQGTTQDILLPVGTSYRKLMVQAKAAAAYPWQVANILYLSEDNDKKVPLNEYTSAWMKVINSMYPAYREGLQFGGTATTMTVYGTPYYDINIAGALLAATAPLIIEKYPLNEPFTPNPGATTNGMFELSGYEPHACILVPFGNQDDMEDWYDTSKIGTLLLRITAGSAGTNGSVKVVTQELKKY